MGNTIANIEQERNRRLRRVDWRFLLSNPYPRKSACFTNGFLRQCVAEISQAIHPSGSVVADADCDLVVAVNPNAATLRAAWSALEPGGSLYSEWHSPLVGGETGIRKRLQTAQFIDIECYWAWPLPDYHASAFWLPIDAWAVLRYFRVRYQQERTIWRRIKHECLWTLWHAARRTGLLLPVSTIARKPYPLDSEQIQNTLIEDIRLAWRRRQSTHPPARLSWLLLTGGYRSINKVVGLIFADDEELPRMAVKLPRAPESAPALQREALTLRVVRRLKPGGIPGVPRILAFKEHAGLPVLVETALTGTPMWAVLSHENYRILALQVTDWLLELVHPSIYLQRTEWWAYIAEPVLADHERFFGSILKPNMLQETRSILSRLGDLPLTVEQRDLSPWNILVGEAGQLLVLDWESAEIKGLPVLDLCYFLTHLAFMVERVPVHDDIDLVQARRLYHDILHPNTFTGQVVSECMTKYIEHAGLTHDTIKPLRVLTWLIHAQSEYRSFSSGRMHRPSDHVLRQSLCINLWEEELQCGL
ncbi:MAG: aminoglycoside phosphotransferase family protein [Gammaproteobacteria bacterium]|nr:aminoglycoside phosphotransferase family protein [Gammaproteobacteria bacterium]